MKRAFLLFVSVAAFAGGDFACAVTVDSVLVADVGNANDPATGNLYGGVNSVYRIGTYEVTVGQYAEFLNAVAKTDSYGLYSPNMSTVGAIAGIARAGNPGSHTYSVIGSPNHPVTYISWGDAARFANWIQNGQPTGAQSNGLTETGAYTLNGATTDTALMAVTRNAGARWFLPTLSEWYKAAYYQPVANGGDTDGYWTYPMKTNSVPYSDQPPGATPDNTRVGNFRQNDGLANGYDDGYAVTGSNDDMGANLLTDGGAYSASPSFYNTFDQGGNVWEWTESAWSTKRVYRGGCYACPGETMAASYNLFTAPTDQFQNIGFRVASSPGAIGDFAGNDAVDAADFVLWRNINGPIADYNLWKTHFGEGLSGTGSSSTAGVPEPLSLTLIFAATAILCGRVRGLQTRRTWYR